MDIWTRPRFAVPGLKRRIVYEAFAAKALNGDLKVSSSKHGLPPGPAPEGLSLIQHRRPEHGDWLDGFFKSGFVRLLHVRAQSHVEKIRHLPYGWGIRCETEDSADHAILQHGLGFIRAMFDLKAAAVVDVDTGLWFLPEDMAQFPPDCAFSILPFVNVIIEPRPAPLGPFIVNTRGLVKFGRPDMVIGRVPQQYLGHAQTLLYTISNYLAQGAHLRADESMTLKESPKIFARDYPKNDPLGLAVNNDAILLTDEGNQNAPGDVTRWLSWWAEHSIDGA